MPDTTHLRLLSHRLVRLTAWRRTGSRAQGSFGTTNPGRGTEKSFKMVQAITTLHLQHYYSCINFSETDPFLTQMGIRTRVRQRPSSPLHHDHKQRASKADLDMEEGLPGLRDSTARNGGFEIRFLINVDKNTIFTPARHVSQGDSVMAAMITENMFCILYIRCKPVSQSDRATGSPDFVCCGRG